jgi:hypothetical protein
MILEQEGVYGGRITMIFFVSINGNLVHFMKNKLSGIRPDIMILPLSGWIIRPDTISGAPLILTILVQCMPLFTHFE